MKGIKPKFALSFLAPTLAFGCASSDLLKTSVSGEPKSGIYIPYVLPKGLAHINVSRNDKAVLSLEILDVKYRPDPDHQYYLEYDHSAFWEDTVSVEISGEGYLKTISAKSKDQRGEVLTKVIELAGEVGKAFVGVRGGGALPEFSYEVAFDPTDPNDVVQVKNDLTRYGVEVSTLEAKLLTGHRTNPGLGAQCTTGACFRPAQPYELTIAYQNRATIKQPNPTSYKKRAIIALPNEAPLLSVELDRYAFVEAHTTVTFSNGMLTKVDLTKPSEAVGFMNVPIDVAKAIVSIPSAIFDFKVSSVKDDKSLLDNQSALIQSQMALSEKQAALLQAQKEALETANAVASK